MSWLPVPSENRLLAMVLLVCAVVFVVGCGIGWFLASHS